MKVQSVNIDLQALGAEFSGLGDDEQVAFFRGLAGQLKLWPSEFNAQCQFSSVGKFLKESEKKILKEVLEMLWYKEE